MKNAVRYVPNHELRRPGMGNIIKELAAKYPHWTLATITSEAKVEWHRRNPTPPLPSK